MNEGAGDWICSDPSCGNINFARRVSCYRCNKDRPDGGKMSKKKLGTEIGKSAAEKSRGLFNADDWQCNKCANVNWARRTTCNVCNAPKFGEVEARTGYGGGYNERGVVEYRRREPSSDDEYDEFGRKKRKRKLDAQNTVGITEGPLAKKLPSALVQMELNKDAKEDPAPNVSMQTYKDADRRRTLSESSMCDLPPLSKMAFRRHQLETQTKYNGQEHMLPSYKTNGTYLRKRFPKTAEQDSLNNKIASKILKQEINNGLSTKSYDQHKIIKTQPFQPLKNDVVYKFTGPNPTEDFEVTYSIEERVKVAAYAIVHNNCKISTEKFEALYDKPAPDFKTIFAWRQRLLRTGCLDDSHLQSNQTNKKNICESPHLKSQPSKAQTNPEEIPISSDSETEYTDTNQGTNNMQSAEIVRSTSAETLVLSNTQKSSGSSGSIGMDRALPARNHSSPHCRASSRESQDSIYADSDLDKPDENSSKLPTPITSNGHKNKQSTVGSDSDSVSYDSDYVDFLSRVYGEGTKPKSSLKKRQTPVGTKTNCESLPNDVQIFQGYSTVNKSEQSPLATGNIYTSSMRNMRVKSNANLIDADGGSAEYVPTKLGYSTKNNYQDFKNNVKKKGFWAKGNHTPVHKNKGATQQNKSVNNNEHQNNKIFTVLQNNESNIPLLNAKDDSSPIVLTNDAQDCIPRELPYITEPQIIDPHGDDFTNDDFEQIVTADNYTPFDVPLQSNDSMVFDNSSRIFDVVQSDSVQKNKSIMEIFDVFDDHPNQDADGLENNGVKPYTVVWDEDDDALYKDDDDAGVPDTNIQKPLPNEVAADTQNLNLDQSQYIQDVTKSPHHTSKLYGHEVASEGDFFSNKVVPLSTSYQHEDTRTALCQVLQPNTSNEGNGSAKEGRASENIALPEQNIAKKINIIESITIKPKTSYHSRPLIVENQPQGTSGILAHDNKSPVKQNAKEITSTASTQQSVNLSNLLAGINTDTLLLALQNLQQLAQKPPDHVESQEGSPAEQEAATEQVETINLTNDEDWEQESDREGSIEKQLKKLHGNTGDTPFLSDIFDPGPVVIPPNVAIKLNINGDNTLPEIQENTSVIGNFKSFALPKPIMLNRLKLTIKQQDKTPKQSINGGRRRRKTKSKASTASGEGEAEVEEAGAGNEGDEEESGDDADLSKYDLWGSDDEKAQSSKPEPTDQVKDGDAAEAGSDTAEKNGKNESLENKAAKRRSRSSSSSSSSSSTSSSSRSSAEAPKNKFDDFNLNSERESPPGRRSRSPHARGSSSRRKAHSRDSRSHDSGRDKKSRGRRGSRSRSRSRSRPARKERRYSRDAPASHYPARGRHR